jgi:hypothetical protein
VGLFYQGLNLTEKGKRELVDGGRSDIYAR